VCGGGLATFSALASSINEWEKGKAGKGLRVYLQVQLEVEPRIGVQDLWVEVVGQLDRCRWMVEV
jgi:hypothetical protein